MAHWPSESTVVVLTKARLISTSTSAAGAPVPAKFSWLPPAELVTTKVSTVSAIGVAVAVGVAVFVAVAVGAAVGVSVGTGVSVGSGVAVSVAVGTGVAVAVLVGTGVSVAVGTAITTALMGRIADVTAPTSSTLWTTTS